MKSNIFFFMALTSLIILLVPMFFLKKTTHIEHVESERDFKSTELLIDNPEIELIDNIDSEITRENENDLDENDQISKTTIEIRNVQTDNENVTYTYNVIIRDIVGAIKYTIDGEEAYAVFSSKGEATFNLNSNQTLIIYDIPYNTYYSIEQVTNNKYVTSVNNKKQNIMEGVTVQNNIITFDNTSKVVNANPNTADYSIVYIASGILSFIALIVLIKTIKVKRFTN